MKNKVKNILLNKNLWFFTAITIIFFGILTQMEFAVDTYATLTFSLKEFIYQFVSSGRFALVLIGEILKILKLKSETIYMISYITAIICMIVSLYKLYKIVEDDIKNKYAKKIVPILIVLNAFSIELFLFIEKGMMLFAVLMCIFAVSEMKKWLEHKKNKYLITTFIFMLLANFSYQGVVGIFVAISIVYILKYSKNIKQFIINNIVVALTYGIPAVIDYVLIKITCASSRVNGSIILSESLKKVFSCTKDMIKTTYGILPKYLLILLIAFTIILIIYQIVIKKDDIKYKILDILKVIYIIAGTLFATIAPQIMQNTDSIWLVARSTYSYAALYGILVLYLFMNYKINKKVEYITIILSLILLVIQFYRFNIIAVDRYKVNEMDYEITRKICEEIDEYEKSSGSQITKIAIYEDKSMAYTYYGLFSTGDTNIKAYSKDWSIKFIIKYYSGKDLSIVEKNSKIEEDFKQKDWTSFENEQLIFDGDTLHFCRY